MIVGIGKFLQTKDARQPFKKAARLAIGQKKAAPEVERLLVGNCSMGKPRFAGKCKTGFLAKNGAKIGKCVSSE